MKSNSLMRTVFFVLLLLPMSIYAQDLIDITTLNQMSIEELMTVKIVTASKTYQKVSEAPASVEVITAEDIMNNGYTNLEEVLHDLPGFNFSKANGITLSTVYQRGYRSNNTDRTILMIDGVPENDLWKGVAWLDKQYPLSNIKRIEVVYGPVSVLYGANAFQGVINIITKDGADLKNTVNLFTGYGSYNTLLTEAVVGRKIKDLDFIFTFRKYDSEENDLSQYDDWDYLKPEGAVFVFPIDKYKNDKDDYSIHMKAKNKGFTLGGIYWNRRDDSGATYVDSYQESDGTFQSDVTLSWNIRNMHLYGSYESEILKNIISFTRFTFMRHEHTHDSNDHYIIDGDSLNVAFIYRHELSKGNIFEQQFSHKYTLNGRTVNTTILGFQYDDSFIQGNYIESEFLHQPGTPYPNIPSDVPGIEFHDFYDTKEYGFFIHYLVNPYDNLSFILGTRYDHQRIRHDGGFGWIFNPRLGTVYFPVPRLNIKLLYGTGYSAVPNWTLFSTTDTRMANPNLPPEIVQSREISVGYQINDFVSLESAVYHNKYNDKSLLVVHPVGELDPDNPQVTDRNEPAANWRIWGSETRLKFANKHLSAYLNYSFAYPYDEDEDEEIGNIGQTMNFGVNYHIRRNLNFNFKGNYVGERNSIGRDSNRNFLATTDSYIVFHSNMIFKDIISNGEIALTVNNIFDTEYFDPGMRTGQGKYPAQLPQNGRNFFVRIGYSF